MRHGLTLLCLAWACPAGATASQSIFQQVAPGIFVRHGACEDATPANRDAIANDGFVIGANAVAVVDPGGSMADGLSLRDAVHQHTRLPIRFVIMTHAHPDHVFGGAAFLPDHPVFVGHWRLPAALATRADYDRHRLALSLHTADPGAPVTPTSLVHDTATLDLGGRILTLRAYGIAHSDTDLTVFDATTATLWAGDLLFVGRVPSLDGNLTGWLRALDVLQAVPAARVIPGHGPVTVAWPAGAADERRYLTTLLHDVRADIAKGEDPDHVAAHAAQSERGRWCLFDDYNGHNAIVAFKELQWE